MGPASPNTRAASAVGSATAVAQRNLFRPGSIGRAAEEGAGAGDQHVLLLRVRSGPKDRPLFFQVRVGLKPDVEGLNRACVESMDFFNRPGPFKVRPRFQD